MKDNFDMFLQCMNFRMVPRIFLTKPVLKAVEKSAIFIALMVIQMKRCCHANSQHIETAESN